MNQLDLKSLIEYAKTHNLNYLSAMKNLDLAQADLLTTSLFPNPTFLFSQTFIGGTRFTESGSTESAPTLSMELDLFGKRTKKMDVAQKGVRVEELQFADFDRIFQYRFRQLYRQYLFYSSQSRYKKQFLTNYLNLLKISSVRKTKGDISGLEFDRLELEKITHESDFQSTELLLLQKSQQLRTLLGLPPSSEILQLSGELKFLPVDQILRELIPSINKRPDLTAILEKASQTDSLASLKKRERIPSPTLLGEYRIKGDRGYFGFSVSFPIPVLDRNQGAILKAEESSTQLRLSADAKNLEIQNEISTYLNEVRRREKILREYQESHVLEKNEQVAERFQLAYLKRAFNIVALLDSQRNYLNVMRNYYEQVYLYYMALDSLNAAMGDGTSK